ncbi:MAG: hypothetical protein PUD20_09030 [bacterium]|nr:hypothetical protein [bacterium]
MSKRVRQYLGIIVGILGYYIIHEGAHLIAALIMGTFKQINFLGLGVQIDVFREKMTDVQLGIFCLVGAIATFLTAYLMILLIPRIGRASSKVFRACMYYLTIVLLFADPLYLGVFCGFFGGGDMNGIALLVPEIPARVGFGCLFVINLVVFIKVVLPKYKASFAQEKE